MDIRNSPLVTMAEEAERPTRWWVAWIVAVLIILIAGAGGTVIGDAVLGSPESPDTIYQYEEAFVFGATLLALMLWVTLKERRSITSVGFGGTNALPKLLIGLGIGAALMTAGVLVTAAIGQYETGSA